MMFQLDSILANKQREVNTLKAFLKAHDNHKINQLLKGRCEHICTNSFRKALLQESLAVIAEIKRRSPSKNHLADIADPVLLATCYVKSGANAISVLTDKVFFGGLLSDLELVSTALKKVFMPILRKEFIIDEVQIAESALSGANAILLMVSVLGHQTRAFLKIASAMNIEALVEVHDLYELDIALSANASIIGINNRNLKTLEVNPENAFKLIKEIPSEIIAVAESGILSPVRAREYFSAGFQAVLIGEALVKSEDPARFIQECKND